MCHSDSEENVENKSISNIQNVHTETVATYISAVQGRIERDFSIVGKRDVVPRQKFEHIGYFKVSSSIS